METGGSGASVDVFWRSGEGFEMHLQLAGSSSETVLSDAHAAIERIKKAGGAPRYNRDHNGESAEATPTASLKCEVCGKKLKYREGESRAGKSYKGYFCPDRDCEGKPVWVDE